MLLRDIHISSFLSRVFIVPVFLKDAKEVGSDFCIAEIGHGSPVFIQHGSPSTTSMGLSRGHRSKSQSSHVPALVYPPMNYPCLAGGLDFKNIS